jgi:hypothetical protein
MRSLVALYAVALSFFVAIGRASGLGDIDLGLRSSSGCGVSASYYPGWDSEYLPLDKVNWGEYSAVIYAFA